MTVFQTVERVRARFKNYFKSSKKEKFVLSVYTVYPLSLFCIPYSKSKVLVFHLMHKKKKKNREKKKEKEGENKSLWPSI